MSVEVDKFKLPEHVSYSAFTTWLECGWLYFLSRMANTPEKPAIWNLGGSAVHKATELYDLYEWKKENE
jgi:hypothetical protein